MPAKDFDTFSRRTGVAAVMGSSTCRQDQQSHRARPPQFLPADAALERPSPRSLNIQRRSSLRPSVSTCDYPSSMLVESINSCLSVLIVRAYYPGLRSSVL